MGNGTSTTTDKIVLIVGDAVEACEAVAITVASLPFDALGRVADDVAVVSAATEVVGN